LHFICWYVLCELVFDLLTHRTTWCIMIRYLIKWHCELPFDVFAVKCLHVVQLWIHMSTMYVLVCTSVYVHGYISKKYMHCALLTKVKQTTSRKYKTRAFAMYINKIHTTSRDLSCVFSWYTRQRPDDMTIWSLLQSHLCEKHAAKPYRVFLIGTRQSLPCCRGEARYMANGSQPVRSRVAQHTGRILSFSCVSVSTWQSHQTR
jgi:hypothetical protein